MFEQFDLGICFDAPADKGADVKTGKDLDAKQEFRQVAAELKDKFDDFKSGLISKSEFESASEKMNTRLDDLEFNLKNLPTRQESGEKTSKENITAFKKAMRHFSEGDRKNLNSESVRENLGVKSGYHSLMEQKSDNFVRFDVASGGALLMPEEMSTSILYNAVERNAITRLVNNTTTSSHRKIVTIRTSTPGLNWVEEEGTTAKGKTTYRKVALVPKKAAARYGMSIEEEMDSQYDLESEISRAYEEDFDVSVGSAVTTGDGNGKPKGVVGQCKAYQSASLSLTTDILIRMQESLLETYQANANWLFTRKTRAYIRTLVLSSTNGLQYTWEPDFTRRTPTLLLGSPVNIAREGDLPGEFSGDFSAGQVPILYGDFAQGYELTMRNDMYIIDDPYTESADWIRNYNIMSRVDGQATKADEALVELQITAP
jgi:HK97 family phage major capsid protein